MNIKKQINENIFTALFTVATSLSAYKLIGSQEGLANLYETVTLTSTRISLFLITIFLLTKLLAGVDKDIKADLFSTPENTTKTWIALVIGIALVMIR